ncbi:MAG TPA: phosphoglycerate dehydrogenase [Candidatus Omnitrophota bacterium]|nr:phosphoglycerate dehydrogenase [Candidatus Omnitrophota bacterium]
MNILISDKLADEGVRILTAVKNFRVDCKYGLTPDQLRAAIPDYHALIVRSETKVTEDIINAADSLKVIGRAGVGLDNVDLKAATKKGIVAMNTPSGNTTATAEHTMSLILALSRNIPQAHASLKQGIWDRSKFKGVELHGKTLGVIGFGRIGSTVAKFAKAFGMEVLAYDPFLSMELALQKGVAMVDLRELVQRSDYITVHIPLNEETKDLISDREFALMKRTARLINCARGGIVNEPALVRALEKNGIAGCALDVYDHEPLPQDSPLLKFDHCIVTPHLGAATSEAQINVAIEIAESVRNALLGKGIANAVNFPSVDAEAYEFLSPYINLGLRLGKFAGQLVHGRIKDAKVVYSGAITKYQVAPVTLSLVNGLLTPVLGDRVNFVNALDLAKERAINVQEIVSNNDEEFVNCLKLQITTDKEIFHLWGALSGNKKPRIVKINEVYVEANPDEYMLFINNTDKPGLIGAIGTILAEANINIAGISLSREAPDGVAVSVVNVDSKVPEDVVEKLTMTKGVLFVKLLKV